MQTLQSHINKPISAILYIAKPDFWLWPRRQLTGVVARTRLALHSVDGPSAADRTTAGSSGHAGAHLRRAPSARNWSAEVAGALAMIYAQSLDFTKNRMSD